MYKRPKFLFFIALIFCLGNKTYAQEVSPEEKKLAQDLVATAEEIMAATQAMDQAREMYVQAVEADPTNIKANYMAGDFHLRTVGKDRAVKYFLKVLELDPEYRFDITYWIGRSYQYGMDFDKALEFYTQYRNKLTQRDGYRGRDRVEPNEVERRIYECENAKRFVANPSHYSIVNIGNAINSEYEEYAPVLNEDETIMVFTSRRRDGNLNPNVFSDNKPYEDIFITRKQNGKWSYAQNIGEIVNTEFHDSNLALSADGSLLFLYKDDNNGDIYVSERKDDGTWTYPHPMSESINSEGFKESSISITPDQNILFFASDRPGGSGGIDIYYSVKNNNGEWARSKNLGPVINTPYDDDGPFIDYDGKTLYFSSQGRDGMGGYDIFKSVYDSAANEWSEPENLGFPINTPDDDIYFVSTKDGKRGYYASVREDGLGYTDIYMVTILQEDEVGEKVSSIKAQTEDIEKPDTNIELNKVDNQIAQNTDTDPGEIDPDEIEPEEIEPDEPDNIEPEKAQPSMQPVTVMVTVNDENGEPTDAKISMKSLSDNLVAGKISKGTGMYEFSINSNTPKVYRLSVEKDGYVFQNLDVAIKPTTEAQEIIRSIDLRKLMIGTRSVLRNIYFNFDKATFKDESYNELNKLENMMAQNPGMEIEISGHTDSVGPDAYNKSLSQKRANAVKDYLVKKGIDSRRVTAVGYGEEKPLASNDDEKEGRELNRRVEFKVIGGK